MTVRPAVRWSLAPGAALRWRSWDGLEVVYDERSGDTHLLEPVAAAAIRTLEAAPATADEWIACVTARLGIAPDDELRGRFAELIARFDELGLIVADAPEPPHAD